MQPLEKKTKSQLLAGDRVLVTGEGIITGGRMGTVFFKAGLPWVMFDGNYASLALMGWTFEVRHRPTPPRPEVDSFTRSNGREITWSSLTGKIGGGPMSAWVAYTAEDARNFSRMYAQGAELIDWTIARRGNGER